MQTTETFFRPEPVTRHSWTMPPALYRLCRQALRRSGGCAFVPVRTMQYQAVIDAEELIFVDALGGYMVQDGEGGRVIGLAWRPRPPGRIASLSEPVPCEVIHYRPALEEIQRRMVGELGAALRALEVRSRGSGSPRDRARVVALRR